MEPEISVVIPHLNQPESLARLLDSLYSQQAEGIPFEIIVADNGSDDPLTGEIFSRQDLTIVREPAPGPGPARNKGVAASRGRILAFIDSDCIADSQWIRSIHLHFESRDAAPVIGGDVRIAINGWRMNALEAYESIFGYRFYLYIRRDGYAGTGNLAVLRQVFDEVGPFAGIEIAEDRDWGQRATRAGFALSYVPDMVIYTPARPNFRELCRKWDRHIAHEFRDVRGIAGILRWIVRSVSLALSPVAEIPRILTSDRVQGARAKILAWCVLFRIRLFRARRMMSVLFSGDADALAYGWQRKL